MEATPCSLMRFLKEELQLPKDLGVNVRVEVDFLAVMERYAQFAITGIKE